MKKKPSVLEQLQTASKIFSDLVYYEFDVSNDMSDAIDYDKMRDSINEKIRELKERSKN